MRTVVFAVRGCPAGWLGAYGNEWVGTPNLDRLAAESVVFDRHISDRPEPTAATAAWLGGAETAPVLAALRAANVPTILVRANHPDTDGPDWFYAAWGEVFDARPQEEDKSSLGALLGRLPGVLDRLVSTADFLLWIEIDRLLPPWDVRQDVFDAYIDAYTEDEEPTEPSEAQPAPLDAEPNGGDEWEENVGGGSSGAAVGDEEEAHTPGATANGGPRAFGAQQIAAGTFGAGRELEEKVPPWHDPPTGPLDATDADAWEWLHATFAAVVTSLDAELGVVFELLRARGLDQSASWLLTSDYGHPLGEHGQIGLHRPWLHEELVHLPFILRLPNAAEAGRRVAGFTQPSDTAGTLLDLFGLKQVESASLLPLARGEGVPHRTFAVTSMELNGASELALRTPEWAYLLPVRTPEGESREPMLFEKPDDRWEVNDLRARNLERADELESRLKQATVS